MSFFVLFAALLKLGHHTPELFIYLGSYCVDSCIVGSYHGQHRFCIDRRNDGFSGFVSFINNDIAGKQQSDTDLLLQSLVCQRWIAGTEDHIVAEIYTELLFQFRLDVDFTEDTKAFLLECNPCLFDSLFVGKINCLSESLF